MTIDKWRADKTRVYKVQNLQGKVQYSIRNSSCDICRIILLNVLTIAIITKRMICLKYPFLNSFLIYCRGLLMWNQLDIVENLPLVFCRNFFHQHTPPTIATPTTTTTIILIPIIIPVPSKTSVPKIYWKDSFVVSNSKFLLSKIK